MFLPGFKDGASFLGAQHLFQLNLNQEAGMSRGRGTGSGRRVQDLLSVSGRSSPSLFLLLACVSPCQVVAEWEMQSLGCGWGRGGGVSGWRLGFVLPAVPIAPKPLAAEASAPRKGSKETQGDRVAPPA